MPIPGWPPDKCEMPELTDVDPKLVLGLMIKRMIGRYIFKDEKAYSLVLTYVRTTDKMVDEYNRTKATLREFVESPGHVMSPLFFATNHCESLLSTMVRLIRLGRRIRTNPNAPPIDRRIPVLSDGIWRRVNEMRNAIEHVENQIASYEWPPDEPELLILKNDRLLLIGKEILYTELANWVHELHVVALTLLSYEPGEEAPPVAPQISP